MTDEKSYDLPGLLDQADDPDYVAIHNLIKTRGLTATLDLLAEFCERRIAYAVKTKNRANNFAWTQRYNAIRFAVLTIDKHKQIR